VTNTRTPTPTPTLTNVACGTATPLVEGFESGLGNFNSGDWYVVTTPVLHGSYAAHTDDPATVSDQRLTLTSPIDIPSNTSRATLTFYHTYGFDAVGTTYYDGGVLELSTNGGSTWIDA